MIVAGSRLNPLPFHTPSRVPRPPARPVLVPFRPYSTPTMWKCGPEIPFCVRRNVIAPWKNIFFVNRSEEANVPSKAPDVEGLIAPGTELNYDFAMGSLRSLIKRGFVQLVNSSNPL